MGRLEHPLQLGVPPSGGLFDISEQCPISGRVAGK